MSGLHQAADILEKYGICSETDLSELEQDDFSELESEGLFACIPLKALGCKEAQALVSNFGAVRTCTCRENVAFLVKYPISTSTRSIDCDDASSTVTTKCRG